MSMLPFAQRFGFDTSKPVTDDFPDKARVSLAYLLKDLIDRRYVMPWHQVHDELHRVGAITEGYLDQFPDASELTTGLVLLQGMEWHRVYTFCERAYKKLLRTVEGWDDEMDGMVTTVAIGEVRDYYQGELNELLGENNIGYHFVDGEFQRRGRAQTQKSIQRVGMVLSQTRLAPVRDHFNKALKYFNERPAPEKENCVKEAVCALEAAVDILTGKPASKDFTRAVKQLQGNDPGQIPPPIAEGMIKLHAYRGSAQGVGHAALQGSSVSEIEAELVLSLVASYVTYLADLFPEEGQEIPF